MKFILIIVFLFLPNLSHADEVIRYLDLNFILNKSNAGINIISQLEKKNKKLIDSFKKKETSLKDEENKLIKQQNILEKNELDKKIKILKDKITLHNENKISQLKALDKMKINAQSKLINVINNILVDYSEKNSISIIINKKSIIIGHSSSDITDKILKITNNKNINTQIN